MKSLNITFALVLALGLANYTTKAQNLAVNNDGSSADASAIFDAKSTTKGMLVPRMTQTQRNAIATPATGLLIYQTDNTAGFYYYNGTIWTAVTTATDNLGNHTATTALNLATNNITNANNITATGTATLGGNAYPTITGTNGQVLTTNGAGTLNWTTPAAVGTTETASNGLTKTGNNIELGGNLTSSVVITQNNAEAFRINNNSTVGTLIDLQNTGNFRVLDNGVTAFQVLNTGTITAGTTNQFQIDNTGDITRINGITTSFPSAQGTNGQVLTNNGAGTLSWTTIDGLPTGTINQTLRHNGTTWVANNNVLATADNLNIGGATETAGLRLNVAAGHINAAGGAASHYRLGGISFAHNTGTKNTFLGAGAGNLTTTGTNNTVVGAGALTSIGVSNNNVVVGADAAPLLIGGANTIIGSQTAPNMTSGAENVIIGRATGNALTVGNRNIIIGVRAMQNATTTNDNIAIGRDAMSGLTTGTENTAVGTFALLDNVSGANNTAFGRGALSENITGSNNTAIGYEAKMTSGSFNNSTVIGANATMNASNKIRLGDTNITVIEGQVPFTNVSDARLKENITDSKLGLNFLMKLRPVQYTMINGNKRTDYGFIAQELATVVNEKEVNLLNKDGEYYTVRYNDLIAPTVKAIQEQQAMIKAQAEKIAALEKQVADKDKSVTELKASLETQQQQINQILLQLQQATGKK
jgi:trimeric autotransporter adhesin